MVVTIGLDERDLAELPFLDDPVASLDEMGRAPALGSHLHDPPVLAGRGEHGLAFHHVHADRLLHVDIGTGLDGGNHGQGVPVVGRGDEDDVQVFLRQHLPVVRVGPRPSSSKPGARPSISAASASIFRSTSQSETTSTGATWIRRKRSRLAVPSRADQAHALGLLIRECQSRTLERRPSETGRAGLKKPATIHGTSPLPEPNTHPACSIHFSGARSRWRGVSPASSRSRPLASRLSSFRGLVRKRKRPGQLSWPSGSFTGSGGLACPGLEGLLRTLGACLHVLRHLGTAQLLVDRPCLLALALGSQDVGTAEEALADGEPARLQWRWAGLFPGPSTASRVPILPRARAAA